MRHLGFGWFKRRALRNFASVTEISLPSDLDCIRARGQAEVEAKMSEDAEEALSGQGAVDANILNAHGSEEDEKVLLIAQIDPLPLDMAAVPEEPLQQSQFKDPVLTEIVGRGMEDVEVKMTTHFPFDHTKTGAVPLHGNVFEYDDDDTGRWESTATFVNGRLLQRRHSEEYGDMWDTRVIFKLPPGSPALASESESRSDSGSEPQSPPGNSPDSDVGFAQSAPPSTAFSQLFGGLFGSPTPDSASSPVALEPIVSPPMTMARVVKSADKDLSVEELERIILGDDTEAVPFFKNPDLADCEGEMEAGEALKKGPCQNLSRMLFRWTFRPKDSPNVILVADRWSHRF